MYCIVWLTVYCILYSDENAPSVPKQGTVLSCNGKQGKIIFWQLGAALYCQCCHNQLSSQPPFWSTPPTPHGGIDKIDSDGGEFVEYVNLASMMNNILFFGNYMDPKKTLLVGLIYRYSA